jgi:hypothetical protein
MTGNNSMKNVLGKIFLIPDGMIHYNRNLMPFKSLRWEIIGGIMLTWLSQQSYRGGLYGHPRPCSHIVVSRFVYNVTNFYGVSLLAYAKAYDKI